VSGTGEPDYALTARYRSEWWTRYFNDDNDNDMAYFWPSQLDEPELGERGYRRVSRSNVFAIASTDSGHRELHTAVAAYVWGVAHWAFQVRWRVRAFTLNRETVEAKLRTAATMLEHSGPVEAYDSMLAGDTGPGGTRIPHMGPAYFAKFLFFIGYHDPAHDLRPLILDRRVATALRQRGVFDQAAPNEAWPTSLYEQYLTYCHTERPDNPQDVEIDLFNEGGA
jgi:hypothetical protein